MTRDRFQDPMYLVRLIGDPEQVTRERNTLSAPLRLQAMSDIFPAAGRNALHGIGGIWPRP